MLPGKAVIRVRGEKLHSQQYYPFQNRVMWPDKDGLRNLPGVYEIIALDKDGQPKSLNRIGGDDKRGVLYLGRSQHLRGRLNALWRMLYQQRLEGHIAGITYRESSRIRAVAPRRQLAFRFEHCDNIRAAEDELLRRYFRKFGEVPPLNGRAEFITKTVDGRMVAK